VRSRFFKQLVSERLSAPDCQAVGWVLDGFPHTKSQAMWLFAAGLAPDKVIILEGSHALLMERIRCVAQGKVWKRSQLGAAHRKSALEPRPAPIIADPPPPPQHSCALIRQCRAVLQ
jgi:adenylate kinase family enzyme